MAQQQRPRWHAACALFTADCADFGADLLRSTTLPARQNALEMTLSPTPPRSSRRSKAGSLWSGRSKTMTAMKSMQRDSVRDVRTRSPRMMSPSCSIVIERGSTAAPRRAPNDPSSSGSSAGPPNASKSSKADQRLGSPASALGLLLTGARLEVPCRCNWRPRRHRAVPLKPRSPSHHPRTAPAGVASAPRATSALAHGRRRRDG